VGARGSAPRTSVAMPDDSRRPKTSYRAAADLFHVRRAIANARCSASYIKGDEVNLVVSPFPDERRT